MYSTKKREKSLNVFVRVGGGVGKYMLTNGSHFAHSFTEERRKGVENQPGMLYYAI